MGKWAGLAVVLFSSLFATGAHSLTLEELERYDQDGDKALNEKELEIYRAHLADPVLAKYDTDTDGKLNAAEFKRLRADIDAKYGTGQKPVGKPEKDPRKLFAIGKQVTDASRGGIPIEDLVQTPKAPPDECKPTQEFYVRRDRMDTFLYGITPRSKAQGASVAYTGDEAADVRTAKINGFVALSPKGWRQPCIRRPSDDINQAFISGYAIAPWVNAQGTVSDVVRKSDKSALSGGFDAQWMLFSGRLFNLQVFKVSPYYQTDFRGIASAQGIGATWEPWQYAARLGGSPRLFSPNLDWFWRIEGEVDARRVDKIGFTDLAVGNYAWAGGTAQLYAFFFPTNTSVPEFLRNRLKAILTFQGYWDAYSSRSISRYAAELAYNITEDGAASISIGYERGTSKDTMTWLNQYVVRLNYKY